MLYTGNYNTTLDATPGSVQINGDTSGGRLSFRGTTTSAYGGLGEMHGFWDTNKVASILFHAGTDTSNILDSIMSQITLPGSIFLAMVAVFPAVVVKFMDVQAGWALFFGGTSLLIMVGVAIDTMQQVNSYLLNKHYDGLMKSGSDRKPAI